MPVQPTQKSMPLKNSILVNWALGVLPVACVVAMLVVSVTAAEAQAEAEDATNFAKSFLGKPYSGNLSIEGWTDISGGLVAPPIYVQQYQREDGAFLVLTSKETEAASSTSSASYQVMDALLVAKPKRGAILSIACTKGEDYTFRFIGEARGSEKAEWWTRMNRAWEIELETGKILETKTKGMKCENPSW